MTSRAGPALAGALLLAAGLAGCADDGATDLAAAPEGSSPACAELLERAPATVLDRQRGEQQAVGVATWGDPPVVLQCGVDLPEAPSSDPCITVNDVDWLLDNPDDEDAAATFVAYGRTPGVRVTVPGDRQQATGALVDLAPAVSPLPSSKRCQ
jgi:hypothetical protein